jgi:lipopolysaccharide export LptBFGC system permease protein LptF
MIKIVIGFVLIFGGVGGMENSADDSINAFLMQLGITIVGLLLMFWGSRNLK